ncbi:MAG: DNA repair protein RecN [Oscillospiraceae bacterium]|jgi:DNA repair protein RecN (Recombination protein N)|nr:DNA repair protein RecN [Oscillospiraceae bacterium]
MMIQLIHIENIAVIESAEIEFERGFNVLTGETGAGKSIVIDALSAVTGGRASRELVRTGAEAATVTAVFSGADTDADEDGNIYLSRRVSADGKSVCRVNGVPVPASHLRELGGTLIDIHGQNDGRQLLDDAAHRAYLDGFGRCAELAAEYSAAYSLVLAKQREIDAATMDESEKERLADMLRYQVGELEAMAIQPGEIARLEARRALLRSASQLTGALDGAYSALQGGSGETGDGAVSLISEAQSGIEGALRYSGGFAPLAERLRDLRYAAQDIAEELRARREELEFSPEELEGIEDRRAGLLRVTRKYGGDEESAIGYLEECRAKLSDIEFSGERALRLNAELAGAIGRARSAANDLTDARRGAAGHLKLRITEELARLNMSGVKFEVEFEPVGGELGLSASGNENVRFLMSANTGEAPGRISRIASGGELSRIMLALKNVLTENDGVDAMVFDEVDTGVSGVAAQRVAEKLSDLAGRRQVLCVTHLPQIAAMADAHFAISKSERGGRTVTSVTKLDENGRILELSRLIGGENVTGTTMNAAREQLHTARRYKKAAIE